MACASVVTQEFLSESACDRRAGLAKLVLNAVSLPDPPSMARKAALYLGKYEQMKNESPLKTIPRAITGTASPLGSLP